MQLGRLQKRHQFSSNFQFITHNQGQESIKGNKKTKACLYYMDEYPVADKPDQNMH